MEQINIKKTRNSLVAYLQGEIDHHSAQQLREQIDAEILSATPETLILDFSGVTFTDSSAIGLVLGRNTMMRVLGGKTFIQNPPKQMERILRLAKIPMGRLYNEVLTK